MAQPYKIGIIAALEREIQELLSTFSSVQGLPGTRFRCYSQDNVFVICAGIGQKAAAAAAEALIQVIQPNLLASVGFAGALDPSLHVGDVVLPATVLSEETGRAYRAISGAGVLVSIGGIAGAKRKAALRQSYNAQIIDMEAVAVAASAERAGIPFLALKAISDEADVTLPDLSGFIAENGKFNYLKFLAHLAFHPGQWPAIRLLAKNSAIAAKALNGKLKEYISRGEFGRMAKLVEVPQFKVKSE